MKTSVRFLSMLLAVLMIASAALTASAKDADATANSEALQLLVDLGIFGGYDDGSLKPDSLVERDEMAKIIFVLYTTFTDAGTGVVSFKDVAENHWAAGYISWCSSKGIVGGYGDGNFGPDDNVTYDQALKMVAGALGYTEWDSKLWPTDVRTKALKDLELGKNLTNVKGSDKVTRAQIAQIVYNALFADMNETKKVPFTIAGIELFVPEAKTLAVDVWNFEEINAVVTATEQVGFDKVDEDYIRLAWTEGEDDKTAEFTLEELGLEAYENKLADLFCANVRIIYDSTKDKINEDSIIATSVTETGDKDIEITYDEKTEKIYINGEKVDEDAEILYFTEDNGIVTGTEFNSRNVPAEDSLYTSIVYDFDDDGEYDAVYYTYLAAFEVTDATDKKVSVAYFGESVPATLTKDEISSSFALAEDDVIVAANIYNKFVVLSKVEPVEAAATKYNKNKLTLEGVGEVEINKTVFVPNGVSFVSEAVMKLNDKGTTDPATYYIYDGKVFGTDEIADDSDLQFAIISYFNDPTDPVLNETTMEYDVSYTAVVSINGKQQVVNIDADDSINGLKMSDDAERATILADYGKVFVDEDGEIAEKGKYLYNRYILATYSVDEDGYYSFKTGAEHEDFVVYPAGSTLKYNKATGLYSIIDEAGNVVTNRVKIADTGVIYYTYQKETTGEYTYLGSYTKDTMIENFDSVVTTSPIYALYNEETNFSSIKLMLVDEEAIEIAEEKKADYKTDARQIYYCYQSSNQVMAPDGKSSYYSHFMKPFGGANLAEEVNENPKGTATTQGYAYIWDEETENYVKISKSSLESMEITSVGIYEIDEIINGCIVTTSGKYVEGAEIAPDASIWCLGGTAGTITTLTLEGVQKSIDINKEYREFAEANANEPQRVIIGTHINENDEEVVSVVIIQQFVYNSSGDPARNTTTFINNFNS